MSDTPSAPPSTVSPSPSNAERAGFGVDLAGLNAVQLRALAALAEGQTIRDAAATAGINRVTLGKWLKEDPAFRAAFNGWREELVHSTRARLLRTAELAAEAVHKAIQRGDGRLALALLDRLGLASAQAAAPALTDPAMPRQEIALKREEQMLALEKRTGKLAGRIFYSNRRRYLDDLCQQADQRLAQLNASVAFPEEGTTDASNLDQS